MNKNDLKLIIIIISISLIFIIYYLLNLSETNNALVYHNNDLIMSIDLNKDNNYTVKGDNGDVLIEVSNHKIRVNEENSPYHLCSKQGYISKSGQSITCLPNKIIIEIPNDEIDTQVK